LKLVALHDVNSSSTLLWNIMFPGSKVVVRGGPPYNRVHELPTMGEVDLFRPGFDSPDQVHAGREREISICTVYKPPRRCDVSHLEDPKHSCGPE